MFNQKGFAHPFLLIILIVGIIISVVLVQTRTNLLPKASTSGATLSISPLSNNVKQSCDVSIDINLDTGGFDTYGTDVVLLFNPAVLEAILVQNGSIYGNYPTALFDNVNGKIRISGLASISSPFNGAGKFATVNFKVRSDAQIGATPITFDFDPNNLPKTNDTNVVEKDTLQDRLASVVNGEFQIGSGSCGGSPSLTGDINSDSKVDFSDLEELKKYLGFKVAYVQRSDLNNDGVIDNLDAEILSGTIGVSASLAPTPTPTPSITPTVSSLKLTNISVSSINKTSAIIKWKTDYPGTTRVSFGKTQSNLNSITTLDEKMVLLHQANLNNLSANTKYFYKVYSKNSAGVEFSSTVKNFTTKR